MTHRLAYIAGLLDGEGSLQIIRGRPRKGRGHGYYRCNVTVRMTDNAALALLKTWYPESYYYHLPTEVYQPGRRPSFMWGLYDGHCRQFLEDVSPYLLVKRDQANLLLDFLAVKAKANRHKEYTPDYWRTLAALYQQVKALHRTAQAGTVAALSFNTLDLSRYGVSEDDRAATTARLNGMAGQRE
jgi:hypothetical protein